jgi:deoxyribodipyrimidine photo-lyase
VVKIQPVIVWFRDDLRLSDHPGLYEAASRGAPVVGVYVRDEQSRALKPPASRPLGGASRWWLAQSLRALDRDLRKLGQRLVLRRGKAADVIPRLAREAKATQVYFNRRSDRAGIAIDDAVIAALKAQGVTGGHLPRQSLGRAGKVLTADGGPLRVFTPFWKRVQGARRSPPAGAGADAKPPPADVASETLEDWKLEPTAGLGRRHARDLVAWRSRRTARLKPFLDDGIRGYADERDRPDKRRQPRACRRYLRFGEISPRQIWYAARFAAGIRAPASRDVDKFLSELGWREFCLSPAVRFSRSREREPAIALRCVSLADRRRRAESVATRTDRLPDRRCRHARALAHRL